MDIFDEIAEVVAKKANIPAASARIAVQVVIEQVAERLPAPFGAQVQAILKNSNGNSGAMDLGNLAGMLSGFMAGKK